MIDLRDIKLQDVSNWDDLVRQSPTATFFQTKSWLEIWLKHFPVEHKIIGVYEREELIGMVPLNLANDKVNLLGITPVLNGELVSDFGDIIAKISYEKIVWQEILAKFKVQSSKFKIELDFIREDSPSYKVLKELGGQEEIQDEAPYLDLPKTWEEYLDSLDRHNRHELKRKMRKIENEDMKIVTSLCTFEDINELFRLMEISSEEKRRFLSKEMKAYFQDLITSSFNNKTAELMFMQKDHLNIAVTLSFIYQNDVLLYNSGFDPEYGYLSAGLILKAHLIKRAIEQNMKRFDFLRGNERYKYDLGGKKRKLYKITFKN
ncbi:GNAT family N-acetyltransferase [Candidatus Gottesmanbacteria bacterium]|nr:GNAT family N-acetyltransferase [Candidatus Gottesmanbacteria bacterium]